MSLREYNRITDTLKRLVIWKRQMDLSSLLTDL